MDERNDRGRREHDNPRRPTRSTTITRVLEVPDELESGRTETYFSRDSRLIVLEGPRGNMLARYTHPETPDPERHRFLTTYPEDYREFEGSSVPDVAGADVEAVCFPVESTVDQRSSVSSGAGSTSEGSSPTPEDVILSHGSSPFLTDQKGIRTGPNGTHVHGADGNGLSIDQGGVRLNGSFEQPSAEKKGVTQASPLFGLVPKSVVTFFAADFLPALDRVQKLIGLVQAIRFARAWVSSAYDAINRIL
jgi:hypothetical protein